MAFAYGVFPQDRSERRDDYPAADQGWAQEISCRTRHGQRDVSQLLDPARRGELRGMSDLGAAVNRAVLSGVTAVSNSYGGNEWPGETGIDSAYNHPGIATTASSGDPDILASTERLTLVTAVGGTSLYQATNTVAYADETACRTMLAAAAARLKASDVADRPVCANRTLADVSAVADPNTPVWVYARTLMLASSRLAAPDFGANHFIGVRACGQPRVAPDLERIPVP